MRLSKNLMAAQAVATLTLAGALLLAVEGYLHFAMTAALVASVILLVIGRIRTRHASSVERLAGLRLRDELSAEIAELREGNPEFQGLRAELVATRKALADEVKRLADRERALLDELSAANALVDDLDQVGQELAGELRMTCALLEEERDHEAVPPQVFEISPPNGTPGMVCPTLKAKDGLLVPTN